ncbi:hypothetical protein ACFL1I_08120 [Candidatus Omnitrophota bacterium]
MMIILLTIAIIGATLVACFFSVNLSARTVYEQAQALYLAEAGLAHAVYLLRNQAGQSGLLDDTIGPVSLGEGTYQVKVNLLQSFITSQGDVRGIKRTVQLQYDTF